MITQGKLWWLTEDGNHVMVSGEREWVPNADDDVLDRILGDLAKAATALRAEMRKRQGRRQ